MLGKVGQAIDRASNTEAGQLLALAGVFALLSKSADRRKQEKLDAKERQKLHRELEAANLEAREQAQLMRDAQAEKDQRFKSHISSLWREVRKNQAEAERMMRNL